MCTLNPNPHIGIFSDFSLIFIRSRACFAGNKIANIDLVCNHTFDCIFAPKTARTCGVFLIFALIVIFSWRNNPILVQLCRNCPKANVTRPHFKNSQNDGCGVFVYHKFVTVFRAFLEAIRRICSHIFTILRRGALSRLYLDAGCFRVLFIIATLITKKTIRG